MSKPIPTATRFGVHTFDSMADPNAPQPGGMRPGDRWRRHDGDFVMLDDGTLVPAVRLDAEGDGWIFRDCYMPVTDSQAMRGWPLMINGDHVQWGGVES